MDGPAIVVKFPFVPLACMGSVLVPIIAVVPQAGLVPLVMFPCAMALLLPILMFAVAEVFAWVPKIAVVEWMVMLVAFASKPFACASKEDATAPPSAFVMKVILVQHVIKQYAMARPIWIMMFAWVCALALAQINAIAHKDMVVRIVPCHNALVELKVPNWFAQAMEHAWMSIFVPVKMVMLATSVNLQYATMCHHQAKKYVHDTAIVQHQIRANASPGTVVTSVKFLPVLVLLVQTPKYARKKVSVLTMTVVNVMLEVLVCNVKLVYAQASMVLIPKYALAMDNASMRILASVMLHLLVYAVIYQFALDLLPITLVVAMETANAHHRTRVLANQTNGLVLIAPFPFVMVQWQQIPQCVRKKVPALVPTFAFANPNTLVQLVPFLFVSVSMLPIARRVMVEERVLALILVNVYPVTKEQVVKLLFVPMYDLLIQQFAPAKEHALQKTRVIAREDGLV